MSVRCLGFFLRHLILVSRVSHFHIHPRATRISGDELISVIAKERNRDGKAGGNENEKKKEGEGKRK